MGKVWDECYRCARDSAVFVINVNSRRVKKRFYPIAFDIASRMRGWVLWDHVVWYIAERASRSRTTTWSDCSTTVRVVPRVHEGRLV